MKTLLLRPKNFLAVVSFSLLALCIAPKPAAADLSELSIEQLINLKVTSVSKKAQKLSESAAAIFVITQEDLRRSGATSIAEALRMVPGLDVARVNSNTWAISSRGFNLVFADKLLVLVDGRSVYTPLFSGVYWDVLDTMLQDIDRIEVIRGPGAALWGANAVNGIINIITKDAADTQGALVSGGGGSEERAFADARYGEKVGESTYYRVFAKYFDRDNFADQNGDPKYDGWQGARGGFRVDSHLTPDDTLLVEGDGYYTQANSTFTIPTITPPFTNEQPDRSYYAGTYLLSRWTHAFDETSEVQTQAYYDRSDRSLFIGTQAIDTFDIDTQYRMSPFTDNELLAGFEYRFVHDDLNGTSTTYFDPEKLDRNLYSWFIQDEHKLIPDRLRVILGSKFESNDYTGFEFQPTGRVLVTVDEQNTIWGAVSRAVRTPNRANNDVHSQIAACPAGFSPDCPGFEGTTNVFVATGNRDLDSEEEIAYELGLRSQLHDRVSLDVATFYNDYDKLIGTTPSAADATFNPFTMPPTVTVPVVFNNLDDAHTYGVEVAIDARPYDWWRLVGTYTNLFMDFESDSLGADGIGDKERESPRNQFSIRSLVDLPYDLELDAFLWYVDELDIPGRRVPSYTNLNLRVGWKPTPQWEVSVVGQNLVHEERVEYISQFIDQTTTQIEQGVYARLTWYWDRETKS